MQSGLWICDLIGALAPGSRPLEGKSFYLDEVKSRSSTILTELIGRLGGKVESFLNKDVSVVVTGNREAVSTRPLEWSQAALRKVRGEEDGSPVLQKERTTQRPGTPRPLVYGSRGKTLLEKAIRSQEKSRGSVLSSASSWGVKIVSLDEFLKFVDRLRAEISYLGNCANEKNRRESSVPRVKAGFLKTDFIKVEDSSRRYRPLYVQSLPFPMLSYSGCCSPFGTPASTRRDTGPRQDTVRSGELVTSGGAKPPAALSHTPSRRKNRGYCECCQTNYPHLDQHLESELHRSFVLDSRNYAVVDLLVDGMDAGFVCGPDCPDDALPQRLSCGSPAPLNPCTEVEYQPHHETDGSIYKTGNHGSDHLLSPAELEPLWTASPPSVEPSTDVPPPDAPTVLCVDDDLPPAPSPCLQGSDPNTVAGDTRDSSAPVLRVGLDDVVSSPSLHPSHQPTLDKHEGERSPRQTPSTTDHAGPLEGLDHETQPLNVRLSNRGWNPGGVCMEQGPFASVESPSFPPSCENPWVKVNPRKRCGSFPPSPTPSKKARQCSGQRSDLTIDQSVKNGCASYISASPPPVADVRNNSVRHKPEMLLQDLLSDHLLAEQISISVSVAAPDARLPLQGGEGGAREERVAELNPTAAARSAPNVTAVAPELGVSSEPGPPELYPFYRDDDLLRLLPPCCDPPTLLLSVTLPSPQEGDAHAAVGQASAASHLSQSFSSFCLESALVPNFASSTSSDSDWDSGLLAWLAAPVPLRPSGGRCEPDLGLLLQRPCAGAQDGSYASQLCSVLQAAIPLPARLGERMNPTALCKPREPMEVRVMQSLGT